MMVAVGGQSPGCWLEMIELPAGATHYSTDAAFHSCYCLPAAWCALQQDEGLPDVFKNFPKYFADGFRGRGHEVGRACMSALLTSGLVHTGL